MEAEHVAIGDVVGDREEVAVEGFDVFELEVFAAGEMGDGLGDVAAEGVAGGDFGKVGKSQRREEFFNAVHVLRRAALGGFDGIAVGVFAQVAAEAAVLGAWLVGAKLGGFVTHCGFGAVEADAVDGGIGIADGVERVDEGGVAALVDGFGEQEDGAAVGGGLLAEHVDGEGDGVEDGGLLVAGIEVVERAGDEFEVGGEAMQQDGRAVKADDGDFVIDVADEVGEHRAEVAVLIEMAGAGASGFNDDDHG